MCIRCRKFRGESQCMDSSGNNFHKNNFHNDHQNSCGKTGITSVRKTWTKYTFDINITCQFYVNIGYDEDVFYVVPDLITNKNHCYRDHISLLDNHDTFESNRHLSQDNEKKIADIVLNFWYSTFAPVYQTFNIRISKILHEII